MKAFFEEYGLSVILGCVICLVVVMCSPVGTAIKGGLTDSTDGVKNTGTQVQAKAGKSIRSLAGEEEPVPDNIYVGYNSSTSTLVFSHDENSSGYSACDTKYGDIKNDVYTYDYPTQAPWINLNQQPTISINIENTIKPKNIDCWFKWLYNVSNISNLNNINLSECTSMDYTFQSISVSSLDLSSWDTSNIKSMKQTFSATKLESINLSGWNTSNVEDMQGMFASSQLLTSLNLSSFDTHKVTTMESIFSSCHNLTNITYSDNFVNDSIANENEQLVNTQLIADLPSWAQITHNVSLTNDNESDYYSLTSSFRTILIEANEQIGWLYVYTYDENKNKISTKYINVQSKLGNTNKYSAGLNLGSNNNVKYFKLKSYDGTSKSFKLKIRA